MARRREDVHAGKELRVAVEELVRRAGEPHPLLDVVRRARGLVLRALDERRRAREATVAATVVEMEVGVDHRRHTAQVGPWPEPGMPLGIQLRRGIDHSRIDEDRSGWVD